MDHQIFTLLSGSPLIANVENRCSKWSEMKAITGIYYVRASLLGSSNWNPMRLATWRERTTTKLRNQICFHFFHYFSLAIFTVFDLPIKSFFSLQLTNQRQICQFISKKITNMNNNKIFTRQNSKIYGSKFCFSLTGNRIINNSIKRI